MLSEASYGIGFQNISQFDSMKCQTEQDLIAGRMYANGRELLAKNMTVLVLCTDS